MSFLRLIPLWQCVFDLCVNSCNSVKYQQHETKKSSFHSKKSAICPIVEVILKFKENITEKKKTLGTGMDYAAR